jgi:hypothetical protein
MSDKEVIKFDPNVAHEITLNNSTPFGSGENKFGGKWHGWDVSEESVEKTIFATDYLNDLIFRYEKGDVIEISKTVVDGKNGWEIVPVNKSAIANASDIENTIVEPKEKGNGEIKTTPISQETPSQGYWEDKDDLHQHNIQSGQAWNLALKSFEQFPSKKKSWSAELVQEIHHRQTQFLVEMLDSFASAKVQLNSCTNIKQMNNTWDKYKSVWSRKCSEQEFLELEEIVDYYDGEEEPLPF